MEAEKRVAVFLSEFDYQVVQVTETYSRLKKKIPQFEIQKPSIEMIESAGYWLHNLYSVYEDLFKLVSGFWENNLSTNGDFHINLLKRMVLNIDGIRPSLLSDESYNGLNELRGFRHVFRHAYSYGLDDERVIFLLRKTVQGEKGILKDIGQFRSKIMRFI